MKHRHSGFTLIETLVTISIIAVLATIGMVGVRSAREKAKTIVEINAARNLITGYLGNAAENNGQVIAGYQNDPAATNLEGKLLADPMNARYPWRLAPSVPAVKGVLLYNGTESALEAENRDYLVSVHPNMGINATLVGGHFGGGSPLAPTPRIIAAYGKFYLSHLAESEDPGKLVVFASARSGKNQPGYFEVRSPNLTSRVWSSAKFTAESQAPTHGFVDFRWGGKAVAAMLGGNVELLDETQLRDMRRWSHQAARANDPDFMITRQ
ncbi:MAG: type II secretion system protein [Luteolibacter sp.]|uniref:type II secretion system protein n=1 Tax=Luteolibacter sp. TaxID=1962973 RepID=UPI003264EAE2